MSQKPSISRDVHYQTFGTPGGEHLPEPVAAKVTHVYGDDTVDLFVIYRNGTSHKERVPFAETPTPGHWNWPPRV
ncbi:hypothetical protein [Nocardia thailandica]|uniref:hypothetical protein n=1 Tax=Nocardia thailandica TaxID=257275 RepID=UPI00031F6A70|nr:hypothetical protein [Nocardia thailandica]